MTDEILIRFLKGNANCDEIHLINKWLQDNPQNIDYLKQLHDSLLLIDVWAGKSSQEDQKYINQILKRTIKNKSKKVYFNKLSWGSVGSGCNNYIGNFI